MEDENEYMEEEEEKYQLHWEQAMRTTNPTEKAVAVTGFKAALLVGIQIRQFKSLNY